MPRSLSRCQFVAFASGILLSAVLIGVPLLEQPLIGRIYVDHGQLAWVVHLFKITLASVALAFFVANYSRQYDKAALITTSVPAVLLFLIGYTMDVRIYAESAARHAMTGGMIGYTEPLDLIGQMRKAFFPALWAIVSGVIGIGIKRILSRNSAADKPYPVTPESRRPFLIFVTTLSMLIVIGLLAYAVYVSVENSPGVRIHHAHSILNSSASTTGQRERSLQDIGFLNTKKSTFVLQEAARDQPYPTNILAAAFLARFNNISALPILEEVMMKSSVLQIDSGSWNLDTFLSDIEDPAAIPSLARLMKSTDAKSRISAATALRRVGGDAVIDPLIIGLDDSDSEVRWTSIVGLDHTAQDQPKGDSCPPSFKKFQENEQPYLDYWKDLAATRQSEHD